MQEVDEVKYATRKKTKTKKLERGREEGGVSNSCLSQFKRNKNRSGREGDGGVDEELDDLLRCKKTTRVLITLCGTSFASSKSIICHTS